MPKKMTEKQEEAAETSTSSADRRYVETVKRTGDRRAGVRAYCGNNKWAIENAKGVGNW